MVAVRFNANVAATDVQLPHELVQIAAYVLWEEAGKPEGLSAEVQLVPAWLPLPHCTHVVPSRPDRGRCMARHRTCSTKPRPSWSRS